ncbi:ATP-binding protein [Streptomyces sp. NPDC006332]|uniref:ATP-binding protein n=1 Tax=Streptomyces sp. NPDC006332 TaxID=3155456 RepID=UPI0033B59A2A
MGANTADRATWTLPAVAESARAARRQVATQLDDWGLPQVADDATLIVSELVTNAVCHGAGPVWHALRRVPGDGAADVVRLEVGDHGRGWGGAPAARAREDSLACGGRGLPLVEALSSRWGAWHLPHGFVVWVEMSGGPLTGTSGASGISGGKLQAENGHLPLEGSLNNP